MSSDSGLLSAVPRPPFMLLAPPSFSPCASPKATSQSRLPCQPSSSFRMAQATLRSSDPPLARDAHASNCPRKSISRAKIPSLPSSTCGMGEGLSCSAKQSVTFHSSVCTACLKAVQKQAVSPSAPPASQILSKPPRNLPLPRSFRSIPHPGPHGEPVTTRNQQLWRSRFRSTESGIVLVNPQLVITALDPMNSRELFCLKQRNNIHFPRGDFSRPRHYIYIHKCIIYIYTRANVMRASA